LTQINADFLPQKGTKGTKAQRHKGTKNIELLTTGFGRDLGFFSSTFGVWESPYFFGAEGVENIYPHF
jgi:hypothetical protein